MSSHYDETSLDAKKLVKFGSWAADKIQKEQPKGILCFVYSGMSGTSLATAVAMMMQVNHNRSVCMNYVRRSGETDLTVGGSDNQVEWSQEILFQPEEKDIRIIFIDDFICEGKTFNRCHDALMINRQMFQDSTDDELEYRNEIELGVLWSSAMIVTVTSAKGQDEAFAREVMDGHDVFVWHKEFPQEVGDSKFDFTNGEV